MISFQFVLSIILLEKLSLVWTDGYLILLGEGGGIPLQLCDDKNYLSVENKGCAYTSEALFIYTKRKQGCVHNMCALF